VDTSYPVVITVDGNTYNFTQDSLTEYIKRAEARKSDIDVAHKEMSDSFKQVANIRRTVYEFFNKRHSSGDEELTADVSDINEMLEEIGTDKLRNLYSATVTITVRVDDIEATDEDDVSRAIEDEIQVDIGMFSVTIEDWDVQDIRES
jgi:hypothetical protein